MQQRNRRRPSRAAQLWRKGRRWALPGLCGLAGVALVACVLIFALPGGEPEPAAPSTYIPEGMLLVDDIYEGQELIPEFDLPVCQYDREKFSDNGNLVRYEDGKALAGIDVSEFQGEIDWAQVKGSGMVDFVFLRLGYRGMTQGLLVTDEAFERNFQGATEAGLPVGVYFFSQAITEAEAEAEADFVLSTLDGRKLTYPVVFDWEPPVPSEDLPAEELRAYGADGATVAKAGAAFCKRIQDSGYRPCFYSNKNMIYSFFDMDQVKEYPLWLAEYQRAPSLYYDFRLWQYSDSGSIPGIGTTVDLDICFEPY